MNFSESMSHVIVSVMIVPTNGLTVAVNVPIVPSSSDGSTFSPEFNNHLVESKLS